MEIRTAAKVRKEHIFLNALRLALPLVLLSATAVSSRAGESVGIVKDMKGTASRNHDQGTEPLTIGSQVSVNDLISTDSRAYVIVRFENGSELTIGPDTKVIVDPFVIQQGRDLEAVSGALGFEGESQDPSANSTIRTVFGMIGVRG